MLGNTNTIKIHQMGKGEQLRTSFERSRFQNMAECAPIQQKRSHFGVGISAGPGLSPGSRVPELVPGPGYLGAGTESTFKGLDLQKNGSFCSFSHKD